MPLINWTEDYSVSHEEIDNQHKQLINILNKTHEAMKKGETSKVLTQILDELLQYTIKHFSTEERIMSRHGFPYLESHKKEHDHFTNKVKTFIDDYKKNKAALSSKVLLFLSNWVQNHIQKTDKQYVKYIASDR